MTGSARTALCRHWKGLFAVLLLGTACASEPEGSRIRPLVLVGIDGADWAAIDDLWDRGRLPNLRALAARGATAELTPVARVSPIIWTSVVTGVRPERHGITDFVLPTAQGDIPVSSTVRRVPAIWNMLSAVQRRVAVLAWWVSWPAEPINGVMVSDRALRTVDRGVSPESFRPRFQAVAARFPESTDSSLQAGIARQDEVMGALARQLAAESFDLMLVYFRGVDVVSHPYWKYFQPLENEEIDPEKVERFGELVPRAYEAVDRQLGELLDAAPADANFVVMSDHGFTAVPGQRFRMLVHLNRVLEHLGYLVRVEGEIDWAQTRAVTWDSPPGQWDKQVRIGLNTREPGGPVRPEDLERVRDQLAAKLKEVVYGNGAPVFRLRLPRIQDRKQGADLTVVVHQRRRVRRVFFRGEEIPEVVESVEQLTGTHGTETPGIFIAAGPDIDPTSRIQTVHSLDVTPTLLYGLGLPVAQDFDGEVLTDLFQPEFRTTHPLQTIPSWGESVEGTLTPSEIDEELVEELRALGYLD